MLDQTDYGRAVGDRLLRLMEDGRAPWQQERPGGLRSLPYDAGTGEAYQGINALWLMAQTTHANGWLTEPQAAAFGGMLRRPAPATLVLVRATADDVPTLAGAASSLADSGGRETDRASRRLWAARYFLREVFPVDRFDRPMPTYQFVNPVDEVFGRGQRSTSGPQPSPEATLPAGMSPQAEARRQRGIASLTVEAQESSAVAVLKALALSASRTGRIFDPIDPPGTPGHAREQLRLDIATLLIASDLGLDYRPSEASLRQSETWWLKWLRGHQPEFFKLINEATQLAAQLRRVAIRPSAASAIDAKNLIATALAMNGPTNATSLLSSQQDTTSLPKRGSHLETSLSVPSEPDLNREFGEALSAAGLMLDGPPIMDGRLRRVPVIGDRGRATSGAYVGQLDGRPVGYIQNFKDGVQYNWRPKTPVPQLTLQDHARLAAEVAQQRQVRAVEAHERVICAAETADVLWDNAGPAPAAHPYLVAKNIQPHELRVGLKGQAFETISADGKAVSVPIEDRLIVPLRDMDGKLSSLQFIDATGAMRFLPNGRISGRHLSLGEINTPKSPLLIATGFATAATLHEVTGLPVIAAMNSGNLLAVAQAFHETYPDRVLILAGDDDHLKFADQDVGRRMAVEAAIAVGGYPLLPEFAAEDRGTDWNDFYTAQGYALTKRTLGNAISLIKAQAIANGLHEQEERREAIDHQINQQLAMTVRRGRIIRNDAPARKSGEDLTEAVYVFGTTVAEEGVNQNVSVTPDKQKRIGIPLAWTDRGAEQVHFTDPDWPAVKRILNQSFSRIDEVLSQGRDVVIPTAGLGPEFDEMARKAPAIRHYIDQTFTELAAGQQLQQQAIAQDPQSEAEPQAPQLRHGQSLKIALRHPI